MVKKERSPIAREIQNRVRVLYALLLVASVLIVGKIIYIQFGPDGDELRKEAESLVFSRSRIPAERGDILSSDGRVLATSVPVYDVYMDFRADGLTDSLFEMYSKALAGALSSFFGDRTQEQYLSLMEGYRKEAKDDPSGKTNRYKKLSPRSVDYDEQKEIVTFPLWCEGRIRTSGTGRVTSSTGYIGEIKNRRVKPHQGLASRTIGRSYEYIDEDKKIHKVRYGLEGHYDSLLRGTDGVTMMQKVSGDFFVPIKDIDNIEPVNGLDLVTTINADLQDVADKALREQIVKSGAQWGTVVLMEVATGEIHAIANLGYNEAGELGDFNNYAVRQRHDPGSTFKLFSLIALLEDAGMSLEQTIDCRAPREGVKVGARMVRDDHDEGVISLRRVFEKSSNIGFAKAVHEKYGANPARFVDFVKGMGFGDVLGVDLSGEVRPWIKHPGGEGWDGATLVSMAFGYSVELTPLQTLSLYNAVANNGVMVRPHLAKEVRNHGNLLYTFPIDTLNPAICSRETILKAQECLRGVVDEGTGRLLRNANYTVAAKTGTAKVTLDRRGYRDKEYCATMVGYFPADNPKYSCIVTIKTNGAVYYGASLSGPVFKAVADRVYAINTGLHEKVEPQGQPLTAPLAHVSNGRSDQLGVVARKLEMPFAVDADADRWVFVRGDSLPGSSDKRLETERIETQMDMDDYERLYASSDPVLLPEGEAAIVPPVTGMGLKDAMWLLEKAGFEVAFTGTGRVVSQSLKPGVPAPKGERIDLVLAKK